ncbi:MarR family winged helix-turn-helix transcriptional regulator [Kitasatospora sp. DSM 101779]|uniref:MarR family winged helix-turn-helix transcriptional regulator n=1 Tax=Kitasatospora sp. DSM 101779 TaxID=2853165 RepID=UPI0021D914AE|nr:MarR family winged helix-turn-helix transcriptional regulator [Kitasatospora sp. DSM 101779]MCU7827033.1 MarR family winged helix-turn-helix transcriptional regulator [Kitasatospora sp. DSM 101779]
MNEPTAVPPSLLDLSTYLLSRTGKTARARLAERLADRGLRLWHMAVLAALTDFGPHVQRDLAVRLSVDPSDIAKVVDELAAAGRVDRSRDAADRRRIRVTATDTGRALLRELQDEAEAVQAELLAPLSRAERTQLHGLLRRVFDGTPSGPDD